MGNPQLPRGSPIPGHHHYGEHYSVHTSQRPLSPGQYHWRKVYRPSPVDPPTGVEPDIEEHRVDHPTQRAMGLEWGVCRPAISSVLPVQICSVLCLFTFPPRLLQISL